jgi:acyl-CoA dehydrogenase
MNLDFTDDEKEIKEQLAKLLRERCNLPMVRRVLEGEEPDYLRELWSTLSELGWLSAAIPERYGGLGLGHVTLCAVAEELGRVLAPVPVFSSIYLATESVLAFGTPAQKQELLPRFASGKSIGTFAMWEGSGALRPSIGAKVTGGRLYGDKTPVPDALVADTAVVVASSEERQQTLYLVDLNQPEVRREPLHGIDPSRPSARLMFSGARVEPLGAKHGWHDVCHVLNRAAVLCAFEQTGGAQSALDMTVEYSRARHAFGRPIGGFQAIKHRLADVYIQLELARSNAYYAAWALDGSDVLLPAAAAAARISATRAFELAARELLQVHGGIGMTWESDCHLFYRRSRHLAVALGAAGDWKDELIGLLERSNPLPHGDAA